LVVVQGGDYPESGLGDESAGLDALRGAE